MVSGNEVFEEMSVRIDWFETDDEIRRLGFDGSEVVDSRGESDQGGRN